MATDFGIRVEADVSEIGADNIITLERQLLAVLDRYTTSVAYNASYSVGTSVDQFIVDVGAGGSVTEDWALRIMIDSAVSDNDKVAIMRAVNLVCERYTVDDVAFAAGTLSTGYTAGNGTFQVEVTVTG